MLTKRRDFLFATDGLFSSVLFFLAFFIVFCFLNLNLVLLQNCNQKGANIMTEQRLKQTEVKVYLKRMAESIFL